MGNLLKEKIKNTEKVLGTFFELGSMSVIECLGQTGLDFVIIDNEHGPFETESTMNYVRACDNVGLTPLVRVREVSRPAILKPLDIGAKALIVPCIETVEQAKKVVEYGKFSPIGKRGFCPSRKDYWGYSHPQGQPIDIGMKHENEETLLILQCETVGCLENIETIVSMDGVDGIFIGPFDLSISMGIPGEFDNPEFLKAIDKILSTCKKYNKISSVFTGRFDDIDKYYKQGFDIVTYSLNSNILVDGFKNLVSTVK
nr:aldolase/citrate lyase family protein [uncultured Intestinibacter sp.]